MRIFQEAAGKFSDNIKMLRHNFRSILLSTCPLFGSELFHINSAKSFDFLEYFQVGDFELSSTYRDNVLDRTLKNHKTVFISEIPKIEAGLKSELGVVIFDWRKTDLDALLDPVNDTCVVQRGGSTYDCVFYRYTVSRAPGNSSGPRTETTYIYSIKFNVDRKVQISVRSAIFKYESKVSRG